MNAPDEAAQLIRFDEIKQLPRPRLFVQVGGVPRWDKCFPSKAVASAWIDSHGSDLDWRVGFLFRLKGLDRDIEIVDSAGRRACT
ncbi:hypothetical protein [Paucibacter soli]|uniref:hypothetical protein n=1 Tax=Paucibacter soli TaxID=3133433 RepID=UPI003096BED0